MTSCHKTTIFGAAHFFLQIFVYAVGFALGPAWATRKYVGISFYDAVAVITFPFVYLAERFGWVALGMGALPLNSIAWAAVFYIIITGGRKVAITKRQ